MNRGLCWASYYLQGRISLPGSCYPLPGLLGLTITSVQVAEGEGERVPKAFAATHKVNGAK